MTLLSEPKPKSGAIVFSSLLLALGLVVGGYFTGDGLVRAKMADRFVTMRGLSERNVEADLATWTLAYSASGHDLSAVQAEIQEGAERIRAFFKAAGFPADAVSAEGVGVSQWLDNARGVTNVTVRQRLQLRTEDVELARKTFERQFELIEQGIALEDGSGITYSFTKLDEIKPAMIAEATKDARRGAQQFAQDSGSQVGNIRNATQGYFSIGPRDGHRGGGQDSPQKKVRVVTTVEFYLR